MLITSERCGMSDISVRSEVRVRQCTHSSVPDLFQAAITKPGVSVVLAAH